jgi:hypothetical protein
MALLNSLPKVLYARDAVIILTVKEQSETKKTFNKYSSLTLGGGQITGFLNHLFLPVGYLSHKHLVLLLAHRHLLFLKNIKLIKGGFSQEVYVCGVTLIYTTLFIHYIYIIINY